VSFSFFLEILLTSADSTTTMTTTPNTSPGRHVTTMTMNDSSMTTANTELATSLTMASTTYGRDDIVVINTSTSRRVTDHK
jgi:hypothetical protein